MKVKKSSVKSSKSRRKARPRGVPLLKPSDVMANSRRLLGKKANRHHAMPKVRKSTQAHDHASAKSQSFGKYTHAKVGVLPYDVDPRMSQPRPTAMPRPMNTPRPSPNAMPNQRRASPPAFDRMPTNDDDANVPNHWFDPRNNQAIFPILKRVGEGLDKYISFTKNVQFQDPPLNQMFADLEKDVDQYFTLKSENPIPKQVALFLMAKLLPTMIAKMDALQDRLRLATQTEGKAPGIPSTFRRVRDQLATVWSRFMSAEVDPNAV